MRFFMFRTHPKPSHAEYGVVDGAYVSCWVADPVSSSAETAARGLIEEAGWDVESLDESYPTSLDDYGADDPSRPYVQQAAVDGIYAIFHRWPVGAPDDEEQG